MHFCKSTSCIVYRSSDASQKWFFLGRKTALFFASIVARKFYFACRFRCGRSAGRVHSAADGFVRFHQSESSRARRPFLRPTTTKVSGPKSHTKIDLKATLPSCTEFFYLSLSVLARNRPNPFIWNPSSAYLLFRSVRMPEKNGGAFQAKKKVSNRYCWTNKFQNVVSGKDRWTSWTVWRICGLPHFAASDLWEQTTENILQAYLILRKLWTVKWYAIVEQRYEAKSTELNCVSFCLYFIEGRMTRQFYFSNAKSVWQRKGDRLWLTGAGRLVAFEDVVVYVRPRLLSTPFFYAACLFSQMHIRLFNAISFRKEIFFAVLFDLALNVSITNLSSFFSEVISL